MFEKKQFLDESEWKFDNVDPEEITACFFWEFCREKIELRYVFYDVPKTRASPPRIVDLRTTFLNDPVVFRALSVGVRKSSTPPLEPILSPAPAWQKLEPQVRAAISRRFRIFFQPVEKASRDEAEDYGYWEQDNPRYEMLGLFIDWGYPDAAIKRSLLKFLSHRPKKFPKNIRFGDGSLRVCHNLAPSEFAALGWLGMLRCTARGGKDGARYGPKGTASHYSGKGQSQITMEVKYARHVLRWLETGKSVHLKNLTRNWKRTGNKKSLTA